MNGATDPTERKQWADRISLPHGRVDPCFMTGKACVYAEVVNRNIAMRAGVSGFMIMPFRQNLEVFFKNCLTPFLQANYETPLETADQIRRPGVIICEGICKRIQEANFVVADVSLPNPNSFYELGLAFGLRHKILVIYHRKSEFGKKICGELKDMGCKNPYVYHDLDPIEPREFSLTSSLWQDLERDHPEVESRPVILFYERELEGFETGPVSSQPAQNGSDDDGQPAETDGDIDLDFSTHVRSAVGLAVGQIHRDLKIHRESLILEDYLDLIGGLKDAVVVGHEQGLDQVRRRIDASYCLIVRTGGAECHPMAYFWLGYSHARGKNVIPITIIDKPKDPVNDLAFDIRAQRHMTFVKERPDLLKEEIFQSFRLMIGSDFTEWSRKRFWTGILGSSGEMSIFTGALHNEAFDRETIGDWDLRAVSELTSYFGQRHYRFKIETPIYPPDRALQPSDQSSPAPMAERVRTLARLMRNKNCVLVASPDVNPLTEIVLGTIHNVPPSDWFSGTQALAYRNAIVAFKERDEPTLAAEGQQRAFYQEREVPPGQKRGRGFASQRIQDGEVRTEFASQSQVERDFQVYAHLAVVPNPFLDRDVGQRYIIILNGISGPATFALTHALTGGVGQEFVSYPEDFVPAVESERILSYIVDAMRQSPKSAIESLIIVSVGAAPGERRQASTFDWRRIKSWELDERAFQPDVIKKTTFPPPQIRAFEQENASGPSSSRPEG